MKQTDFSANLARQGLVDDRAAVVLGVADSPAGNGLCLACVNGNVLRLVESDYSSRVGDVIDEIPLREIEIQKASSFALGPSLRFLYHGARYTLTRFNCAKEFLAIIQEENRK